MTVNLLISVLLLASIILAVLGFTLPSWRLPDIIHWGRAHAQLQQPVKPVRVEEE